MITELTLEQYKAHEATRVPLAQLTVLVGPNASGKTSALEAVRVLSRAARMVPDHALLAEPAPYTIVRQGASRPMRLGCAGATRGHSWSLRLTVSDGALAGATEDGDPPPRPDELPPAAFLRLDATRLGEPSHSDEEVPALAEDGYGLATVLTALKVASTERFHALEEAARRVVPRLRGLGLKRTRRVEQRSRALTVEGQKVLVPEKETVIADELLLDFDDAAGLPAQAASEGTLVVLGILAALQGPSPAGLLLLDDLERGLHPKAQRDLVVELRKALATMPDAQIVATTHAPYLLDELSPEEVVVLGRAASGAVTARRLADHPKARLLDVLTTGEFWAAEGEDWVATP
jgi:predicted ATPase